MVVYLIGQLAQGKVLLKRQLPKQIVVEGEIIKGSIQKVVHVMLGEYVDVSSAKGLYSYIC